MTDTNSSSPLRITLYHSKGVEVDLCLANGSATLEIANSSDAPRLVSLVKRRQGSSPTVVNIGAHSLRKIPWTFRDFTGLRKLEVKVCETLEESLKVMRGLDPAARTHSL